MGKKIKSMSYQHVCHITKFDKYRKVKGSACLLLQIMTTTITRNMKEWGGLSGQMVMI